MPWYNTLEKQQVSDKPTEVVIGGITITNPTDAQLKEAGWYELRPLVMGTEIINPQWQ